jgi:hypothetical protein
MALWKMATLRARSSTTEFWAEATLLFGNFLSREPNDENVSDFINSIRRLGINIFNKTLQRFQQHNMSRYIEYMYQKGGKKAFEKQVTTDLALR